MSTTVDPLGLLNVLPPPRVLPSFTPNERIEIVSQDGQRGMTYPIVIAPPVGPATETAVLNMALNDSTDDIVAIQNASTTAVAGSTLKIDSEYMKVLEASDASNLKVQRATNGSTISTHDVGAAVEIWGG